MKMKKYISISIITFFIAISIYIIQVCFYTDFYRRYFSFLAILIFYPCLFISLIYSIKGLLLINKNKDNKKVFYYILCLPGLIFFLFFCYKMIIVLI